MIIICAFHITKTGLFKYIMNSTSKILKFSDKKNSDIFHISAQNIDCGYSLEPPRRGGSNEYPQSMFLSRNKKIIIILPCKPVLLYKSIGFKGVKIIEACFRDVISSKASFRRIRPGVSAMYTCRACAQKKLIPRRVRRVLCIRAGHVHRKIDCTESPKSFILTMRLINDEWYSLRKHAYSNILKLLPQKNEIF